jgi:hypothetical protein
MPKEPSFSTTLRTVHLKIHFTIQFLRLALSVSYQIQSLTCLPNNVSDVKQIKNWTFRKESAGQNPITQILRGLKIGILMAETYLQSIRILPHVQIKNLITMESFVCHAIYLFIGVYLETSVKNAKVDFPLT